LRKVSAIIPTHGDEREDRARILLLDAVAWSCGGAVRRDMGRHRPGIDADWVFMNDERLDRFIRYVWLEFPGIMIVDADQKGGVK
jgi:hypothetical protein